MAFAAFPVPCFFVRGLLFVIRVRVVGLDDDPLNNHHGLSATFTVIISLTSPNSLVSDRRCCMPVA